MRTSALILLLPLVLAACGEAASSARATQTKDGATVGVEITDAWCRATPNGARTGACYAAFKAVGSADRLVSVASSAAATAEVHDMEEREGMMRMSPMPDGLPLPEGRTVTLAPGTTHIMLTGLTSPLKAGEQAPMVMTFESGRTLKLLLPVRMGAAR